MTNFQRGEIWLVDLDPIRGQEIQKTRPAVINQLQYAGFDRIWVD